MHGGSGENLLALLAALVLASGSCSTSSITYSYSQGLSLQSCVCGSNFSHTCNCIGQAVTDIGGKAPSCSRLAYHLTPLLSVHSPPLASTKPHLLQWTRCSLTYCCVIPTTTRRTSTRQLFCFRSHVHIHTYTIPATFRWPKATE